MSSPGPSLVFARFERKAAANQSGVIYMTHAHFHGDLGGKLAAAVGVSLDRSLSGSLPGELD